MLVDRTLARFLAVGVLNTIVGLGIIYACMGLLGMGDAASNAVGYAIGLAVSFVLNRRWTFRHQGNRSSSLVRFLLVFAVAYASNLLVVLALIDSLHVNRYLAQAIGIGAYTTLSYLGSRHFAFASVRTPSSAAHKT